MSQTAVVASASNNRRDLARLLTNLLMRRLEMEMYGWRSHLDTRFYWIQGYRPMPSPSHPDHPGYNEWSARYHYPNTPET